MIDFDLRAAVESVTELLAEQAQRKGLGTRVVSSRLHAHRRARRPGSPSPDSDESCRKRRKVYRARTRGPSGQSNRRPWRQRDAALRSDRHRHRNSTGEAGHDLRRILTGRWLDHETIWRNRPRPLDCETTGDAHERDDRCRERDRPRNTVLGSPCRWLCSHHHSRRANFQLQNSAIAKSASWMMTRQDRKSSNSTRHHGRCSPAPPRMLRAPWSCCGRPHSRQRPFDLALVDIGMPTPNGIDLSRMIKQDPLIAATPVIILTSYGQRGEATLATEAGAAGYLAKPLRYAQLYECLRVVLAQSSRGDRFRWPLC